MNPILDNVLKRLESVLGRGSKWHAKCPAHQDKTASLYVTEKPDGKVTLHCFGGCSSRSVLDSIGLQFSDLFHKKDKPIQFIKKHRTTIDSEGYFMLFVTAVDWECEHVFQPQIYYRYTGKNNHLVSEFT